MSRKTSNSHASKERASASKVIEVTKGFATVKIYPVKNRGKTMFTLSYFVAGRRSRKTFADEAEARREAASVAGKLNLGQQQALQLTGADRESYVAARTKLAPLGIPLHDAITDYAAAIDLLNGQPLLGAVRFYLQHHRDRIPEKRIKDAYEEFLRQQQADNRSVRYIQDIRSRLGRFADSFKMNLTDVDTAMIDQWIRSLGVSGRTRLNFRTLLITFFTWARQLGYLPKNTPTAAEDLPTPKAEDDEIEIYTQAELQKLFDHSDKRTLPVLCLGAFAGLRTAEIERLQWSDLQWDEGHIEIRPRTSKTRSRRLVPILEPLRNGLLDLHSSKGLVVDGIKLHHRLRDLADRAEIGRRANALRHSFASYRLAHVQSADQVALEMGNSPAMIFRHYRQLVSKAQALNWWNPEQWAFPNFGP